MTQQDSDDTVANKLLQRTHLDVAHQHVANEVLHLLESGQTNIAAIAFALQDYQEPLLVNFSRLNHLNRKKNSHQKDTGSKNDDYLRLSFFSFLRKCPKSKQLFSYFLA